MSIQLPWIVYVILTAWLILLIIWMYWHPDYQKKKEEYRRLRISNGSMFGNLANLYRDEVELRNALKEELIEVEEKRNNLRKNPVLLDKYWKRKGCHRYKECGTNCLNCDMPKEMWLDEMEKIEKEFSD